MASRLWLLGTLLLLACGSRSSAPDDLSGGTGAAEAPTIGQDELLKGIATAPPADTPELRAEKRAKLEAAVRRAQEAADAGELDQAIEWLEKAVMFDDANRTVLLRLAEYSQTRSKSLLTKDPSRAYRLAVQAGLYLQRLLAAHHDFSDEEREFIAEGLFNKACAYARANRHEETSQSLAEALSAGFDDVERMRTEPDFEPLRKYPAMAQRLAETTASVESRVRDAAHRLLAAPPPAPFDKSQLRLAAPMFDLEASGGKIVGLMFYDSDQEHQQHRRRQWDALKTRLIASDLAMVAVEWRESQQTGLPAPVNHPVILFFDRTGRLRLSLTESQRPSILEAVARELLANPP